MRASLSQKQMCDQRGEWKGRPRRFSWFSPMFLPLRFSFHFSMNHDILDAMRTATIQIDKAGRVALPRNLREQVEDLYDYLQLLEARARNKGKLMFTTEEVRKQLGLI